MELRNNKLDRSPYSHKNYVGLYIGLFIFDKHIGIARAAMESNIESFIFRRIIEGNYNIGMKTFFRLADFMASKSGYSAGFFMQRLKEEMDKGVINENK